MLDIYGGGGKLLGGTYLILFYLGMVLSKYHVFDKVNRKKSVIYATVFGILWMVWNAYTIRFWQVIGDRMPMGLGSLINPPGIILLVSAVFMLFFCYGIFTLLESNKYTVRITWVLGWIGEHTLYIFFYHLFYLNFVLGRYVVIDNRWLKAIIYMSVMTFGSILIECIFVGLKKYVRQDIYSF